jgi:polysaccharide pyruvyl transferase WcaK-like protein
VLINGEGSIHHRRPSARTLLAVGVIAQRMGKPVHLVNATLAGLAPSDLETLGQWDRIVVREPRSSDYLSAHGIRHTLGADAAWICLRHRAPNLRRAGPRAGNRGRVLVTAGAVRSTVALASWLSELDGEVWYLRVDKADDRHLAELPGARIAGTVDARAFGDDSVGLLDRLRDFDRIISGRHHLNIFAYYLGIPVTVLPGNTYKTEGTRDAYDAHGDAIFGFAERNATLREAT